MKMLYKYICLVTLVFGNFAIADQSEPNLQDLIITNVEKNEALFHNFETKFSIVFLDVNGNREKPQPDQDYIISKEEYHYARQDNKIYCNYTRLWTNDYLEKGTQVFNGTTMSLYREDLKDGIIRTIKQFPTSAVPDRFTNLYRNVKDMTMSEFLKASTIKDIRTCEIKKHKGYLVHLVHCDSSPEAPVEQKIYFDIERGFVPVVVETYMMNRSSEKPTLTAEVLEFTKAAEGIYFPKKARLLGYFNTDEKGNMTFSSDVRVDISDVKVNTELPEDMFEFKFPEGSEVYNEILDRTYTIGQPGDPALEPKPIVGKQMPNLENITISINKSQGKEILVCFFDYEQRPSRNCILELSKKAKELKAKDIEIIAIHTSNIEQEYLNKWLKENDIDFPVGIIKADPSTSLGSGEEQTKFNWGVKALPWLILTDKEHIVKAEGFSINELDNQIVNLGD